MLHPARTSGQSPMHVLFYEFMLSLRRLWRRRVQTSLMLVTFTVSIALSLVSWSLFHTIFLQNPEFDPNGELYRVALTGGPFAKDRLIGSTREDFEAWKTTQTVFSEFFTTQLYHSMFVTTEAGQERLLSANVSSDALRLTGAKPLLGRLFTPDEDKMGTAPVVLMSEKTWRNRFAADPAIIGRIVKIDSIPATVVGVMPAGYRFPNDQEMWQPMGFSPDEKNPQQPVMDIIGRLKPGITPGRATDDLQQILERRGKDTLAARFTLHPTVQPFREYYLASDLHRSSLVLFALALVFVLVSCANAANLAMIDFFGRTPEIASTLALGIPRSAAIRGFCFQLLVTAAVAALLGFGVLLGTAPYVHSAMSRITTPYWLLFTLQWHHFAMAVALAIVSAGVALLVPLGYLLLVNPDQIIRDGAGTSRGTGRGLWRRVLMIGQIALLTVLAISAGLLLRSSRNLNADHWGFDAQKIFASKTAYPDVATPQARLASHLRLLDEIERIPGVAAAAVVSSPVGFSGPPDVFYALTSDGLTDGKSQGGAKWSVVTPHTFRMFDSPFLEGETFPADQKPGTPPQIVINASLASHLWPGQSAVGRQLFLRFQNPKQTPFSVTIRGVVRDFQAAGPKADNNDLIYASVMVQGGLPPATFLYARGELAPPSLDDIRRAVQAVDPHIAIYFPTSVQKVIDIELSPVRLTTQLTSVYALAAVLLCAVGVYSITVSQILQRNREFGIRMALGIAPRPLWVRFARGHLMTAGIGVLFGLFAAAAVAKVMQSLLFGVAARDPATFVLVALTILLVSALACIPSLFRLQRINPAECLRSL